MRNLKSNLLIGFLFVTILGTLSHFLYEWSGHNSLVGLFTPMNESTWEHMKLLFFPMLLYIPIASHFLKSNYPDIANALAIGLLAGTLFIPVFFYTYSGILGFTVMPLDIASFYVSVLISFLTAYRLALANNSLNNRIFIFVFILALCFIFFTYTPPGLAIFKNPPVT